MRRGLEPIGSGMSLRGTKRKLMPEQIRMILESKPESFSPNVVLRPVCQDYLLPTAAYVAGPVRSPTLHSSKEFINISASKCRRFFRVRLRQYSSEGSKRSWININ